ncbi:hypothetical protein F3Y22_tig00110030pilonHSYRG00009 [Hibiscus syriacus]|uniref:RING-type E3 ubiquitin transferase n=1 Tax=Hibiscus syriacus TaxID=106335 RepID=A0A6A3BPF3_HIBSY|nr:E3 ubiquitin-protein ligase SIRP1-like [Hibiscus syriacus]KAE8717711.1 hypothetical protein F3Y22_tig00110030pilonHSYRG00009 [Hibiscus syriacus]
MDESFCYVWEVDSVETEDQSLDDSIFSIEVHASFTYSTMEEDDEEPDLAAQLESLETETLQKTHRLPLDQVRSDPRSSVYSILDSMYIRVENFMIHRILDCANRMLKDNRYKNRKVLRMRVNVDVTVEELPFFVEDDEENQGLMIPASEGAIEGLEEVEVENPIDCAICLDNLSSSCKAKRMPCSHIFHAHCILNWLGIGNFCPTCRFELSS